MKPASTLTAIVVLGMAFTVLPLASQAMNMQASQDKTSAETFAFGHPGSPRQVRRVIAIKALDIRFEPKRIQVHRGETVRFVVTNDGKLAHEFVIGDAQLQAEHEKEMQAMTGRPMHADVNAISLLPGQTKSLVWTFTRDGVTEYACHMPGHFAAGMVGKIVIVSAK